MNTTHKCARDLAIGDVIVSFSFGADREVLKVVHYPTSVRVDYRYVQGNHTCGLTSFKNSESVYVKKETP